LALSVAQRLLVWIACPRRSEHDVQVLIMRTILVLLHRWFGLFIAVFLFVSGLTGAIISWDHELDEWLNPQMYQAGNGGQGNAQSALALAEHLEAQDKRIRVTYLPQGIEPGHALGMSVDPKLDPATSKEPRSRHLRRGLLRAWT
jgi:uncharacterized iron-regulated membrane protein